MNKISVIIPVYNSEKYLKTCIESVINQTYQDIEIILVDDGSKDDSKKICDEYQKKDSRIKVIHKENGGVSNARNAGIEVASGDYITFIDSDDYIDSNLIEELLNNFYDCDIIKASSRIIKQKSKCVNYNKIYNKKDFIKEILTGKLGGAAFGYLFKRQNAQEILFDENTSCMEDTLFVVEYILKNAEKIKTIDTTFYNRTVNENSITTSKDKILKNIEDYIYSVEKIEEKLDGKLQNEILMKKVILIESEMAKTSEKDIIQNIINNENYFAIMEKASSLKMSLRYKFYINLFVHKRYTLMKIYLKTRRILKKIIVGGKI